VLDEEQMLQYTLAILPMEIGGTIEYVPSAITSTPNKRGLETNIIEKFDSIIDCIIYSLTTQRGDAATRQEEQSKNNETKRVLDEQKMMVNHRRIEIKDKRVTVDEKSMLNETRIMVMEEKKFAHSEKRMRMDKVRLSLELGDKVRGYELEIEQFEDRLDNMKAGEIPQRRLSLEHCIVSLQQKIRDLLLANKNSVGATTTTEEM
jgi:hypothetical protein